MNTQVPPSSEPGLADTENPCNIQATLWLMSVPRMAESLLEARRQPLSAYSEKLAWDTEE